MALAAGALSATAVAIAGVRIALGLGALTIAGGVCIAVKMVEAGRLAHRATEECATD